MGGKFKLLAGLAVIATLGAACGGSNDGNGGNQTLVMTKNGGDAQTGTVAQPLAVQLSVHLTQGGEDKQGADVVWETNGNGTVDPAVSTTSSTGTATTTWTLGTVSGAQSVTASFSTATATANATFNATAESGPATSFGKASGDGQSAGINEAFGDVLAAQVTDQYGNGVEGVVVSWSVQSGSVTIASGSSPTNVSGLAAMQATAGSVIGPAVIRATNPAVPGDADFSLNVTPTPVRITAGDIFFLSVKNNSTNPAVDTAAVGTPVVWTMSTGPHSIRSVGSPSFTSGDNLGTGGRYTIIFNTPGTYQYNCGVHLDLMTGRVVVTP